MSGLRRERSRRSSAIVVVLALGGTAVSLMQTVVIPLLPDFPRLLGTSPGNASWLVTVILFVSAVTTPIMSRLADMHGKRRMILVLLAVLLCGSPLGATSDSLGLLILARLLQGFAPPLIPIGISMMRDELPPDKIGGAVALMSATLGIGGAVGLPPGRPGIRAVVMIMSATTACCAYSAAARAVVVRHLRGVARLGDLHLGRGDRQVLTTD